MVRSSGSGCVPWVGSYLGRRTCAGSWAGMPRIIMNRAFIAHWRRMPHSTGRLSASASSHHSLSSAAFITSIAESDFRHAQVFDLARQAKADHVRFNIETKLSPTSGADTPDPETFAAAVVRAVRDSIGARL